MKSKIIGIITILIGLIFILQIKSYAGSFSISSPSEAEPSETVTITITGTNIYGKVNLKGTNIVLSESSIWLDSNTQTVTGKIVGQNGEVATITATPETDNLVDSENPEEVITGSKSATISIKTKQVAQEQQTASTNTNTNTSSSASGNASGSTSNSASSNASGSTSSSTSSNSNSTNKTNNSTKNNTTTSTTTTQNNTQTIVEEDEDQGTIAEFGISQMYIFGVNSNEEKIELEISPEFNIDIFEYICNVSKDTEKIEIEYKSSNDESVKIEGIEDSLKSGENIIIVTIDNNNGENKQYTIKVIKEKQSEENEEELKTEEVKKLISFTIPQFICILLVSILIENVIIYLIYKLLKMRKEKINKDE